MHTFHQKKIQHESHLLHFIQMEQRIGPTWVMVTGLQGYESKHLNGRTGLVMTLHDTTFCVYLSSEDGPKSMEIRVNAENLQHITGSGPRCIHVDTLEYVDTTLEWQVIQDVKETFIDNIVPVEVEIVILLRPALCISASELPKNLLSVLIKSARLEYMGKLSKISKALGWFEFPVGGIVWYNHDHISGNYMNTKQFYSFFCNSDTPAPSCLMEHIT